MIVFHLYIVFIFLSQFSDFSLRSSMVHTTNPDEFPSLLDVNIRILRVKGDELLIHLAKYNSSRNIIDIIRLQETWSTEKNDSFLDIPGYFCVSKYQPVANKVDLIPI